MARQKNPFLPKIRRPPRRKVSIAWRSGPAAGTMGIPAFADSGQRSTPAGETSTNYHKDPRGRPAKTQNTRISISKPLQLDIRDAVSAGHVYPYAGKLDSCTDVFFCESSAGWGSNLDVYGLSHGPVGCGAFAQSARLNLPGFVQGIESFTALHACTNLSLDDLKDSGDIKLERAIDEVDALFPLARGIAVLNQNSISLLDENAKGIAKAKAKELGKPLISMACSPTRAPDAIASFRAVTDCSREFHETRYDVAIPFYRRATGLAWIVAKLLRDIGLNPILEFTGSSTSDISRIHQCKLVIGFAHRLNVPVDHLAENAAQRLRRWFGMPLFWSCFLSPSTTDASIRAIAAHFDSRVQRLAEQVILANQKRVEAVIAHYRPRLQSKLALDFTMMSEAQMESYHLLGMRVGTPEGWIGKTGVRRTPRLVCDRDNPSDRAIDSYIAEAKPDLILDFDRDEYHWRKRGLVRLPFSPFHDRGGNSFWGYDGFACLAASLDHALNSPWRKLAKAPWPIESG